MAERSKIWWFDGLSLRGEIPSTLAWLWINQSGISKLWNYTKLSFPNKAPCFPSCRPSLSPRAGRAASPGRSPASRRFKSKALQLSLSKKFWLLLFSLPNEHWWVKGGMKTVSVFMLSFRYFPSSLSLMVTAFSTDASFLSCFALFLEKKKQKKQKTNRLRDSCSPLKDGKNSLVITASSPWHTNGLFTAQSHLHSRKRAPKEKMAVAVAVGALATAQRWQRPTSPTSTSCSARLVHQHLIEGRGLSQQLSALKNSAKQVKNSLIRLVEKQPCFSYPGNKQHH